MRNPEFQFGTDGLSNVSLFVPGGGSYIVELSEAKLAERSKRREEADAIDWELAERSARRAEMVPKIFDQNLHDIVIFSAGCPGVAAGWVELGKEYIPPLGKGEASGMAEPLKKHLRAKKCNDSEINDRVKVLDGSLDTIGEVLNAVKAGHLNPDAFPTESNHGIQIVAGRQAGRASGCDHSGNRRGSYPDSTHAHAGCT
jgi:hypothetical protein